MRQLLAGAVELQRKRGRIRKLIEYLLGILVVFMASMICSLAWLKLLNVSKVENTLNI